MLFHMEEDAAGHLNGWVLPDNPGEVPRIRIVTPDGAAIEIAANNRRTDLQDRGMHDTGMAGFALAPESYPDFLPLADRSEIRDVNTNVLIYRRYRPNVDIAGKLFRFDIRAMPDQQLEQAFAQNFALVYGTAQRYPQDTFFGIYNNPEAKSLYISGRPNMQHYEQPLVERGFRIVALLRDPLEEMAERLLFARYASNPAAPAFIADHISGLEPLVEMVRDVRFDDVDSLRALFATATDTQKRVLTNPLTQTLGCQPDEMPRSANIEFALAKLSRMDLVGLRDRFDDFRSMLTELLGRDILAPLEPMSVSWVQDLAKSLGDIKQARSLISLDMDLYSYVTEAVDAAIGPVAAEVL